MFKFHNRFMYDAAADDAGGSNPADQQEPVNPADTPPADGAAEPPADDPLESTSAFWQRINDLRGEADQLELQPLIEELGEDLLTPDGTYKVIRMAEERAIAKYEAQRQQQDLRAYAYELHRKSGLPDEDFFGIKTPAIPELDVLEKSIDSQKSFLSKVYEEKGVSAILIPHMLETLIKENKIFEEVSKEHKLIRDKELSTLESLQSNIKQKELEYAQSVRALNTNITETVTTGKGMSIVIPDADRDQLVSFLANHLYEVDGSFKIIHTVSNDTLPKLIEALYFQMKGGDLSKLVHQVKQTDRTRQLKLRAKKEEPPAGGKIVVPNNDGKKTLGEL